MSSQYIMKVIQPLYSLRFVCSTIAAISHAFTTFPLIFGAIGLTWMPSLSSVMKASRSSPLDFDLRLRFSKSSFTSGIITASSTLNQTNKKSSCFRQVASKDDPHYAPHTVRLREQRTWEFASILAAFLDWSSIHSSNESLSSSIELCEGIGLLEDERSGLELPLLSFRTRFLAYTRVLPRAIWAWWTIAGDQPKERGAAKSTTNAASRFFLIASAWLYCL